MHPACVCAALHRTYIFACCATAMQLHAVYLAHRINRIFCRIFLIGCVFVSDIVPSTPMIMRRPVRTYEPIVRIESDAKAGLEKERK